MSFILCMNYKLEVFQDLNIRSCSVSFTILYSLKLSFFGMVDMYEKQVLCKE